MCVCFALLILFSCSEESVESFLDTTSTRSFNQADLKDFMVTAEDIDFYVCYKATGRGPNWSEDGQTTLKRFPANGTVVKAYPDNEIPSVYILNYPIGYWEVVSADKRTEIVLASGKGIFDWDDENDNMTGWVKVLANEIGALRNYSGPVRNAEAQYNNWNSVISAGKFVKEKEYFSNTFFNVSSISPEVIAPTRSGNDTTYHPVPGHYQQVSVFSVLDTTFKRPHLITTSWGEGAPYNQYCPRNHDIPGVYAPAGSEAVAGGQIVYYMHYAGDACDAVYSQAFCTAYIDDDPFDWTNMGQFNKSAANWASFQTSDADRMAAVLLANIGTNMQMSYGVNYSYGDMDALQDALYNEYDLESYALPFTNAPVNPYTWIKECLDNSLPSIVHSDYGAGNVPPFTFIVDGYFSGVEKHYVTYWFRPDSGYDLEDDIFVNVLVSSAPITKFCMNWGRNGSGSEIWCASSEPWFLYTEDHSALEVLVSFDSQGGMPFPPGD